MAPVESKPRKKYPYVLPPIEILFFCAFQFPLGVFAQVVVCAQVGPIFDDAEAVVSLGVSERVIQMLETVEVQMIPAVVDWECGVVPRTAYEHDG